MLFYLIWNDVMLMFCMFVWNGCDGMVWLGCVLNCLEFI